MSPLELIPDRTHRYDPLGSNDRCKHPPILPPSGQGFYIQILDKCEVFGGLGGRFKVDDEPGRSFLQTGLRRVSDCWPR